MKPSSKLASLLAAAFCCNAVSFSAGEAAPAVAHAPVFHMPFRAPAARPPLVHAMRGRPVLRVMPHAMMHFQRQRSRRVFGGGFLWPYLAGDYPVGPYYDAAQAPYAPEADDSDIPYGTPTRTRFCVVPHIIELRPARRVGKLPKVTYGIESFCPSPVIVGARAARAQMQTPDDR